MTTYLPLILICILICMTVMLSHSFYHKRSSTSECYIGGLIVGLSSAHILDLTAIWTSGGNVNIGVAIVMILLYLILLVLNTILT